MKFFTKLLLVLTVFAGVSLILIGVLSFRITQNNLREYTGQNQQSLAKTAMDQIDRVLYERYWDIRGIAEDPLLEDLLTKPLTADIIASAADQLEEYQTNTGPWDKIELFDVHGSNQISINIADQGEKHIDNPEEKIALDRALSGETYYSDFFVSSETGEPAMIFAAPVQLELSPDRKVLGVVLAYFSWPVISDILAENISPLDAHLFNKNGVLIADSESEDQSKLLDKNFSDHPAITKALGGEEGFLVGLGISHSAESSKEALISFVTEDGYLTYRGNGWMLSVSIPTSVAFAPARTSAWRLVAAISFVFFAAIILFLIVIKLAFVRPLAHLVEVVGEIGKGNLARRASAVSKDEIGTLGVSINRMAENLWDSRVKLEQYSHGLEEKVAEKTKDLQNKIDDLTKAREAVLNIAEDAEAEKQRTAREKDKINAILHSIGDGVFVVDKNLTITMYNQIAADISGFTIKDAVGKKYDQILKFVFEKDEKINDRFIKEAISTGEIKEMSNHTLLIRKDGSRTAVADSAAPLKDENGAVVGCVVVFRDVSKERAIDRAKTEFVSLASHQLRTPLSTVNWYAEMLLAGDAGEINKEQKKYLDEIYCGNQRMVELVNALLNVSRLETGTFIVEPEPMDVVKLAQSVIDEQKPQIEDRKLKFNEKHDENMPLLNADQKLLRMVLQNLLSNAVKYTPENGSVNLDLQVVKQGGLVDAKKMKEDSIAIVLSDTGYGIPKAQQDKIFSKLFRADNVREHDTEGTGLGLYIVKAIVDHSGGQVWFESEKDKGTTFYVVMPLTGMKKKEGTKTFA